MNTITKTKSARIFLIRHGETDANAKGMFEGSGGNSPLNTNGIQQACQLGNRFMDSRISAIYASTLTRAIQTAEHIAKVAGLALAIDKRLDEINIGAWEGLTMAEIESGYPDIFSRWIEDYTSVTVPASESFAALADRALAGFGDIARKHPGETVVVVSHGGPIKCIIGSILEFKLTDYMSIDMYNTGVSHVNAGESSFTLDFINDISHLGGIEPLNV